MQIILHHPGGQFSLVMEGHFMQWLVKKSQGDLLKKELVVPEDEETQVLFFSGRQRGRGQLGWDCVSLPKSTCLQLLDQVLGMEGCPAARPRTGIGTSPKFHQTGLPGREHQGSGSLNSTWLPWLPFKDGAEESDCRSHFASWEVLMPAIWSGRLRGWGGLGS